ncbi:NmrA family NAD(P)-binding protein [Nocardia sp. NPDC058666]|uniref:NmrA family NAD(P)-binding protein n=1 Tax=Nocardia sp. NPDC058666 TaxID=3346587 RepID=UPI0036563317
MSYTELDVAVLTASGTQSTAIANALTVAGASVRALTRATAPLDSSSALAATLEGADVVVYTAPLDYTPAVAEFAANVAAAAAAAGVRRVVYNANTRIPSESTGAAGFESRRDTWQILTAGSVPVTAVEPAIYLENLLAPGVLSAEPVGGGLVLRYPLPAQVPVSWISLADLGRVVAAACTQGRPGEIVHPGPPAITGQQLADTVATTLGVPVGFASVDPAAFERGLGIAIGAGPAAGVASIYHWLAEHPDSRAMSPDPGRRSVWLPSPTPIADWVAENLTAAGSLGLPPR